MKQDKIILDPCRENWDTMTPTEQGRHCAKCNKVVHEVHHLDNDAVMKKVEETGGNFCIRVAEDRVLPLPKPWYIKWKYTISATFIALLLSAKSTLLRAQVAQEATTEQDRHKTIDKCRITGLVIDSIQNNEPIPFTYVTVTLPDSSLRGTYTNVDGRFILEIEESLSTKDSLTLKCSMLGYEDASIIAPIQDTIDMEVFLGQQHVCLKTAVIAVERKVYIQGGYHGRIYSGAPIDRSRNPRLYRKILDDYDTKTYHHDEIERFNLGR